MYCPECGFDAGEAKFCPECGNDLTALRAAVAGRSRTTGGQGRSRAAKVSAPAGLEEKKTPARGQSHQPARSSTFSPLVIWILVAIAAVTALAVVFIVNRGSGTASGGQAATGVSNAVPAADTSGTYGELVQRANGLYDQGAKAGQSNDANAQTLSAEYFAVAAKVYAAAWKKQPGDPAVGTDYATSLFYSGQIEAAIKQIDKVLAKNPTFQNALYNKGNYVAMKARLAKQNGDSAQATKLFAEAKRLYDAAVKVDPNSESGKAAAQQATLVAKGQ